MNFIEDIKILEKEKNINIVYGLAGDPPHFGHLQAIKYLLSITTAKVWIILSCSHAFGKKMAPNKKRKEWLTSLVLGENSILTEDEKKRVVLDDIEEAIILKNNVNVVYSIDLMNYFKSYYSGNNFYWAFGKDNANESSMKKFKDYEKLCEWPVIVLPEFMEVRSTLVRNALKEKNISFLNEKIGYELTNLVNDWISEKEGAEWLLNRI